MQGAINPVWSVDGEWIFTAKEGDLVRSRADGSGGPELLLKRKQGIAPTSASPDGRLLAFAMDPGDTGLDVFALSIATHEARLVLGTRSNESAAAFSPDGRFLAYVSDETGRNEVYVQAFPGPGESDWCRWEAEPVPSGAARRASFFIRTAPTSWPCRFERGQVLTCQRPARWSKAPCRPPPMTLRLLNWTPDAPPSGKPRD